MQNHRHSRYLGPSDEFEPACLDLIPFVNDEYDLPNGTLRRVGADDTFLLLPDIKSQNYTDELQDIDAIQRLVEPHGSSLVALYFRIVHPSFPILHKKVFLEKYARNYREFSPPLLAGVYILALNWWVYSPNLALLPKPDAAALQKLALKSLDDVMTRPKLSTIQAGLLISQFLSVDLVPLTARLAAVSQTLGLHRDCSDWRIPDWERGLRRRLIWALFLQDKWVALTHGRDSLVSTSSLNVRFLSSEDFPENATDENHEEGSAEVEKGRRSFSEFIDLSLILADIMEFSGLEFEEGNVEDVLNWAKPLQKRLKDWFSNLPEELRMDDMKVRKLSSIGKQSFPPSFPTSPLTPTSPGYLHLAYFTAEITLHRRIVRSFSPSNSTFPNQATSEARTVCRAAARSRFMFALQFIENLRPIHLQSFWYFSSSMNLALIGSFGMLLWATVEASAGTRANAMSGARATVAGGRDGVGGEGINEEVEFYKERIRDLKWGIRVNCKTAEFMEVGLARLEVSTSILGD